MHKIYSPAILALFLTFTVVQANAQADDNIIWASLKLQKNIKEKTSIAIAPIFRLNEDISNYQNTSIDISVKRKLGKGWSAQLLGRTWFLPDAKNRQFLWFDVAYARKFDKFKVGSFLRYHHAMNINDRNDPDFVRWKTTLFYNPGKLIPFVAFEPWFRTDGIGQLQRIRIEPGMQYKFAEKMALTLVYRREFTVNLDPQIDFNMYVITLSYTLPDKKS